MPLAEVAVQPESLLVAGGRGRVVAGQLVHQAKLVEDVGLAGAVAEVAELLERLLVAGGGGRVVAGQAVQAAELVEGAGLLWRSPMSRLSAIACCRVVAAAG